MQLMQRLPQDMQQKSAAYLPQDTQLMQRLPQLLKQNTANKKKQKKTISCISGGEAAPATPTASASLLNALAFLVQKYQH